MDTIGEEELACQAQEHYSENQRATAGEIEGLHMHTGQRQLPLDNKMGLSLAIPARAITQGLLKVHQCKSAIQREPE